MKSLVSITIVLIWFSNFSIVLSAQMFQGDTPLKYLTKFASDQPTLLHRVAKRQTNDGSTLTPEDMAMCDAQVSDVLCTTGTQLGFVETGLSCYGFYSSVEEAKNNANSCAKGENGQFCGSLVDLYRIRARYIEGNCSRVLTQNSCPSNCRSLLEDFRSRLGCCINAYANTSAGLYSRFYSTDYRVWNLCNVPLPPAACGNAPTINPPDNIQNCTGEDIFNKYYAENLCLPERRKAYSDVLSMSICGENLPSNYIEDLCSVDTNGVPCGALYYRSSEDLVSLDSACSNSIINCISNCRDGITAAKNRYGCCLRSLWFNISDSSFLSSSVLESCDIELPGTCEGVIGSAMSIMKETYILLIIIGLLCLQLLMVA